MSSTRMARVDALNRRKVLERREDLLALERRLDRFREVFGERPAVSLSESLEGVLALVQVEYLMDSVPHGVEAPGVET
ncbi:MAG: hypothetical protein JXA90_05215 [Planctomycetes bacterium]|nr:hypothetical protein [Planctomycetota bacterium]